MLANKRETKSKVVKYWSISKFKIVFLLLGQMISIKIFLYLLSELLTIRSIHDMSYILLTFNHGSINMKYYSKDLYFSWTEPKFSDLRDQNRIGGSHTIIYPRP